MIIFEGQITGTWSRTIRQNHIDFEYNFFQKLNKVQYALFKNATSRFAEFNNLTINLKEIRSK